MHGTMCYLYLFTCGSYLGWAFWPNIPFLAILGSSVKGRNLPRGPLGVGGVRYSTMRCVEGGFPLERCLSRGNRPSGFGCGPCCLTGGVELGGGRVLHVEVFLRGRRLLCSLGAVWFCAKASLRDRRPLCSLEIVYSSMVGTIMNIVIKKSSKFSFSIFNN